MPEMGSAGFREKEFDVLLVLCGRVFRFYLGGFASLREMIFYISVFSLILLQALDAFCDSGIFEGVRKEA